MQGTVATTEGTDMGSPAESDDRYQAFIRNSSEGIWRYEFDKPIPIKLSPATQIRRMFKYAYLAEANNALAKMYGHKSVDEINGRRLGELLPESDPNTIAVLHAFIASGYKLSDVESYEIDKQGREKYFRNSLMGIIEDGSLVSAWGTQMDVTDRRKAELARQRSEERLSLALQASSMGFWEWDVVKDTLYWSDELKRLFGLTSADGLSYAKYINLVHPADRDRIEKIIHNKMRTGGMYEFEHRVIWPDGNEHWLVGRGEAFLENGRAVRLVGTCTNIDDRKRAEELAKRQNSFLEMLHITAVDASKSIGRQQEVFKSILEHACTICDTDQGFIYLMSDNRDKLVIKLAKGMMARFKGHTIVKGEGLAGAVWESGEPIVLENYDTWPGRLKSFPKSIVKATVGVPLQTGGEFIGVLALGYAEAGRQFDEEQVSTLLRLGDLASITLSNAKLLQDLQESEQRFRSLADTAPVLIWLAGLDKRCFYFNKPWLDFTGIDLDTALKAGWKLSVHPDDYLRAWHFFDEAFDTREPFSMEYRLKRRDGVYRWVVDKGSPRFSPTGEFQGYVGSLIDIDDMKRANELVLANAQLKNQQAQLLAINRTKDEFIALASHQLRTPATAVKQYTSLLMHEFAGPLTPEQLKYLQIAFDSNERQLQIINDLLKTAQIDSSRYVLEKKPLDVAKIVRAAAKELQTTCRMKNQTLQLSGVSSVLAEVDANELKLVLINLLENASKYSFTDSVIKLSMHHTEKRLEISVIDNGVGISRADARRIFDKFTRVNNELSDTVTGTGFGLYWVKRIVGLHGGTIRVDSEVGKGSSFIVRLPL